MVDPSVYKDYVLTLLFLKYLSDVWKDHRAKYEAEHPGHPDLVEAMMLQESFVLPHHASFDALHKRRHEAGNGERIDKALHAIEDADITKLRDVFQDISVNSNKLGDEEQKNDILRHLLEDFAKPALDLSPSRVGQLDIIGGAYECSPSHFAFGRHRDNQTLNIQKLVDVCKTCPRQTVAQKTHLFSRLMKPNAIRTPAT